MNDEPEESSLDHDSEDAVDTDSTDMPQEASDDEIEGQIDPLVGNDEENSQPHSEVGRAEELEDGSLSAEDGTDETSTH